MKRLRRRTTPSLQYSNTPSLRRRLALPVAARQFLLPIVPFSHTAAVVLERFRAGHHQGEP